MSGQLENEKSQPQMVSPEDVGQSLLAISETPTALAEVSEEQLQQIAGGCGDCDYWARMRNSSANRYVRSSWLAEASAAKGDRQAAKDYADGAAYSRRMAKEYHREYLTTKAALHPPVK